MDGIFLAPVFGIRRRLDMPVITQPLSSTARTIEISG
jgi:hypothetical protein